MRRLQVLRQRVTRRAVVAGLGSVAATGGTGCSFQRYRVRYRLALEVETPVGLRSGASVFEQVIWHEGGFTPARRSQVKGEATWVEVPGKGGLVALLIAAARDQDHRVWPVNGTWDAFLLFAKAWGMSPLWKDERNDVLERLTRTKPGVEIDVPFRELPMLARLPDPSLATPLIPVDPFDLPGTFGPGVTLKAARLGLTDEPLGSEIDAHLPWLASTKAIRFAPTHLLRGGAEQIRFPPTIFKS